MDNSTMKNILDKHGQEYARISLRIDKEFKDKDEEITKLKSMYLNELNKRYELAKLLEEKESKHERTKID